MKHIYIDSLLDSLAVAARSKPKQWIFTQGKPWLLLTPTRLSRLAFRLGIGDRRIENLLGNVRRYSDCPESFCHPLGLEAEPYYDPNDYPPALCPVCDRVHQPHPLDVHQPCPECAQREKTQEAQQETPGVLKDREEDSRARRKLVKAAPSLFFEGDLSPNWKMNSSRRIQRDWDAAINRILMGAAYKVVAKEFDCSVGLLHKKVKERKFWEEN